MSASVEAQHIPVIVGAGQINDRPADDADGMDSLALMQAALTRADYDAGGGWLDNLQSLGTVGQISFPELRDVHHRLAAELGIAPEHCELSSPSGDSPVKFINRAANRIAAGEVTIAAAVGGEALRTAARRREAVQGGEKSELLRNMAHRLAPGPRQKYGLLTPTDIYPLYENACRAAWGQTLREAQEESGRIWSLFSEIAAANPNAWLRSPVSVDDILTPSPNNRPIAFPYNKLMVANNSVNQGAAVILTSLAEARRRGVSEERLVYVGAGAAAHEVTEVFARESFSHSDGMRVTLERTLALNGLMVQDLDFIELYSCFPCIPKMARRVIGWPVDKPATVFGGLTFGGGPIGNYMMHAAASMVDRLRATGTHGLLFANGGFANYNHAIVLSRVPPRPGLLPKDYDYQAEADARRRTAPEFVADYKGPGIVETYTVLYDRAGAPTFGVILGLTPDGRRFACRVPGEDREGIAFLTSGDTEPVGCEGAAMRDDGEFTVWRHSAKGA